MSKYSEAGVDISASDAFIDVIKNSCQSTYDNNVVSGVGGFCGLYRMPGINDLLLASSTDGVGTKILLAQQLKQYGYLQTIGTDLVAMSVNDIITCGASPLFFLDYYALGNFDPAISRDIIEGIAFGCKLAGCSLIGGEMSVMPSLYRDAEFDLAGFGVGIVNEKNLLGQHNVKSGDVIIGLASSGPHSNGYSLIRSAYSMFDWENNKSIRRAIMEPTKIYSRLMQKLLTVKCKIHAAANITGGGLESNTLRVIPENLSINIDWSSWARPEIFNHIQQKSRAEEDEMQQVFNCGIGFTLIVDSDDAVSTLKYIHSENQEAWIIGSVIN